MDDRELAGRLTTIEEKIDACFKELMFLASNLVRDKDDEVKNNTLESENSKNGESGNGVISSSDVNPVPTAPSKRKHKIRVKDEGE